MKIKIKNIGNKEIQKTNFRWEIFSEKTKMEDNKYTVDYFDIPNVELLEKGRSIEFGYRFVPEITGKYVLHIFVFDRDKKDKIGLHSGTKDFENDYNRIFETYSWYLVLGVIGTFFIVILTLLQIYKIFRP